jgi:hypothetical protein
MKRFHLLMLAVLLMLTTAGAHAANYALTCYTAAGAPAAMPVTTCPAAQWHTPGVGQPVMTQAGAWIAFAASGAVPIALCNQPAASPGKPKATCTAILYQLPCTAVGQTCTPPIVPARGPLTATVSWTAPTSMTAGDPITVPLTYNLYRGQNATALILVKSVTALTTTDTVPAAGTYWYAVSATCASCIESAKSAAVSALVSASTIVSPAPPTGVAIK